MTAPQQTAALQRVVDHAHISVREAVVPTGTYRISSPGLNLYSGTRLNLTGVTLLAEGELYNGGLVNMDNCNDVVITGGTLDGQKSLYPVARVNGINIANSNNVTVTGTRIVNCPASTPNGGNQGDGVYIANSTNVSVNVSIDNVTRNGVSIVGGAGIEIKGTITNTSGNAPGSGVDIEPNIDSTVNGVAFVNCEIAGNNNGITIDAAHGSVTGISLSSCAASNNRGHGVSGSGLLGTLAITGGQFNNNALRQIFVEPADEITIDSVEASGSPAGYEAIYINAGVLSSVTNSQIHDNGNDGLHITGAGQHAIVGNTFWNNATGNFNRPVGATIEGNQEL